MKSLIKSKFRYTILAPTALPKGFVDAKVATQKITEAIQLDENDHKIGHTKVRIFGIEKKTFFYQPFEISSFPKLFYQTIKFHLIPISDNYFLQILHSTIGGQN